MKLACLVSCPARGVRGVGVVSSKFPFFMALRIYTYRLDTVQREETLCLTT
jgi:hypothetical protein